MSTEAVDPMIGVAIAGRYVVREKIGAGGMGSVYVATQEPLGREVAVKVMLKELIADEVAVQRFHAEAQAVSRLNHPNIVTVFDFGALEDGTPFLVMEKLVGETLVSRLRRGPLPFVEAAPVIAQVARALHAAHAKSIVHRDLKPENVMLTKTDANEVVVKVLDFGLAKMVGGERRTGLTASDVIMGTPGYMSPEQIHGFQLDARSDIYALGVISWEMLTGRQLFSASSPVKILMRHLEELPPPPSSVVPEAQIPPAAEALIARMLEKSADRRPSTGEQVAAEISNPSSESWSVAAPGQGLPSQVPSTSGAPVVVAGPGGWDDAFSALGDAPFRAPTPPPTERPSPEMQGLPAAPASSHAPPSMFPHGAPVVPLPPVGGVPTSTMQSRDVLVAQARGEAPELTPVNVAAPIAPTSSATPHTPSIVASAAPPATHAPASSAPYVDPLGIPHATMPSAPSPSAPSPAAPRPAPTQAVDVEVSSPSLRPPNAAAAPRERPRPSEPLWTITRGGRSESGIPESTMRRLAKDGHLKAMDLVAPSGEEPRPAHTFAILGLRPPATPIAEPPPRRAIGARRGGAPIAAIVVVLVVVGVGALLFLKPELVDELRARIAALSAPSDDPVVDPPKNDPPPADERDPWIAVLASWKTAVAAPTTNDEAAALVAKARASLDDATDEGARAAVDQAAAALAFAPTLGDARAVFLEGLARRRAGGRALAAIDGRALAARGDLGDRDHRRALVAVLLATGDPRALDEARRTSVSAPDDVGALALLAECALSSSHAGALGEAARAVAHALARAPKDPRARALKGVVLARAGLVDEAAPLLDERLKDDADDTLAVLARALVELRRGEQETAVRRLERAALAAPDDDRARIATLRLAIATDRAPGRVRMIASNSAPLVPGDGWSMQLAAERGLAPGADKAGEARTPIEAIVVVERALDGDGAPSVSASLDPLLASKDPHVAARARLLAAEATWRAGRHADAAKLFREQRGGDDALVALAGGIVAMLESETPEAADAVATTLLELDLAALVPVDPIFDALPPSMTRARLERRLAARAEPETVPAALIAKALLALSTHDLSGARAALEAAKKLDDTHPVTRPLLALLELAREKPTLGLFHIAKLTFSGPESALLPLVLRAELQAASGNAGATKKAIADVHATESAAKERAEGALLLKKEPEKARALLEKLATTRPFDRRAQALFARAALR